MRYLIEDREAGNVIDEFDTIEEASKTLAEFEESDKKEGTYTPDFYLLREKLDNDTETFCDLST